MKRKRHITSPATIAKPPTPRPTPIPSEVEVLIPPREFSEVSHSAAYVLEAVPVVVLVLGTQSLSDCWVGSMMTGVRVVVVGMMSPR